MGAREDIGFVVSVRCCGNCEHAEHVSGMSDVKGCVLHPELNHVVDEFSVCNDHVWDDDYR